MPGAANTSDTAPIYRELAARLQCSNSKYIPRLLALLAKPEQAAILVALPATSGAELAARLGMEPAAVEEQLRDLFQKGLVFPRRKGGLRMVYSPTELKDAAGANPRMDSLVGDEFWDLFNRWFDEEAAMWRDTRPPVPGATDPMMRVIPKWRAIRDVPGVMWFDDMREILRGHKNTLAINPCSCLRISRKQAPPIPHDLCFVVEATARYCLDRGTARRVSLKEAMDILDLSDRWGLMHINYNEKPVTRLIGNCGSYCLVFRWSPPGTLFSVAPSRFQPVVDTAKCIGCGTCAGVCLLGAATVRLDPVSGDGRSHIDLERCMGCGNCVVRCPIGAISMKTVRPPESVPDKFVGYN